MSSRAAGGVACSVAERRRGSASCSSTPNPSSPSRDQPRTSAPTFRRAFSAFFERQRPVTSTDGMLDAGVILSSFSCSKTNLGTGMGTGMGSVDGVVAPVKSTSHAGCRVTCPSCRRRRSRAPSSSGMAQPHRALSRSMLAAEPSEPCQRNLEVTERADLGDPQFRDGGAPLGTYTSDGGAARARGDRRGMRTSV